MRSDERRELERVAYGRESSEEDRAAARALLEGPAPVVEPRSRGRTSVVVAGIAVLLVAGIGVGWWMLLPSAETAPPASLPTTSPSASAEPVETPTLEPVPEVTISPDIRVPAIDFALEPDVVVQTVELGEYEGNGFWGSVTEGGQACISAMFATPEQGMHKCVTVAEWKDAPLVIDRGWWGISWYFDGSVVWDGI